ncbi:F-type H+-transporting ATPase subunit delta [Selenomonas sp. GACV-9]|uniref:F0F1 ATP synthase subunit delta n=1 Tax=Selenomonas sp. GACV-9 TaxID=3158782 RepID=UPI0008E217AD|nr:F-type H+-transporting ATPase subunit delta [Selenomonas ruminantium]
MLNLQLARKYSRAIFEIAQEEDKLVEYGKELADVRTGLDSVPEAAAFLSNPQVETKAKKEILGKMFEGELSANVYNFLMLLIDKRRIALLSAIEDEYRALSNEARGILIADVTTAEPASSAQQESIKTKLAQVTGKKVELRLHENKDIIGGVIVKIGDRRIDGSVAGRLETLRKELLANK